jgi:hypothetical protein
MDAPQDENDDKPIIYVSSQYNWGKYQITPMTKVSLENPGVLKLEYIDQDVFNRGEFVWKTRAEVRRYKQTCHNFHPHFYLEWGKGGGTHRFHSYLRLDPDTKEIKSSTTACNFNGTLINPERVVLFWRGFAEALLKSKEQRLLPEELVEQLNALKGVSFIKYLQRIKNALRIPLDEMFNGHLMKDPYYYGQRDMDELAVQFYPRSLDEMAEHPERFPAGY